MGFFQLQVWTEVRGDSPLIYVSWECECVVGTLAGLCRAPCLLWAQKNVTGIWDLGQMPLKTEGAD